MAKQILIPRVCLWTPCGRAFMAQRGNIVRGNGRFCSHRCARQFQLLGRIIIPRSCRRLTADEPIPTSTPRRFHTRDGYVLLRWKISRNVFVEALEHRALTTMAAPHVHHKNHDRTDNSLDNLQPVTPKEHGIAHWTWDRREARTFYESGWTTTQIAAHYGINGGTVSRGLRSVGTVMRARSECSARAWALKRAAAGVTGTADAWPSTTNPPDGQSAKDVL
jgi:hypothetical protein